MNFKLDIRKSILIFISLILFCLNQSLTANPVNIFVKPKQFSGLSKQIDGKQVNVFLGIPYAQPPIGELRFKKPVPITQYTQPVNAINWPNPCLQSPVILQTSNKQLINNSNFSEDCLYLNIWSPVNGQNNTGELKPVLFFIHGGGFYSGASNTEHLNGDILAAKGDVVVVTINYRLGWFGFLYADSDDAPGNMGLWDQALALKWVNENIGFFGGNPNSITLIGEEVGSQSVGLHILSPITRSLFQNAVMISGGPLTQFYKSKVNAKKMWSNIMQDFQCPEQEFLNGSVRCLRSIKAENLIESTFDKRYKTDTNIIKPFVVFGDQFLPKPPIEMLRTTDFKKNFNLLIGTTTNEGSDLLTSNVDPKKYLLISPQNFSKTEAKVELKNIFVRFFPNISVSSEDIYNLYSRHLPDKNFELIRQSIGTALGDYTRTCPTLLFAEQLFNKGDKETAKIYQFLWSANYDNSWHGPNYSTSVRFIFGHPFRQNDTTESLNERKVSQKAIRAIAHFAKYGVPEQQDGIDWQNYYSIGNQFINPYFEFTKKYYSTTDFNTGYKYECFNLWNKYILNV